MRVPRPWIGLCFALVVVCWQLPASAEEPNAIYVMRPDGTGVRQVARLSEQTNHGYPRWSHDSKRLAFDILIVGTRTRRLYNINVDGTNLQELGPHSMPDWSPDDKQWVAHHFLGGAAPPEIYVHNVDGTSEELVGHGRSPRWSPDGSRLAVNDLTMVRTVDLVDGSETPLLDEPVADVFSGFEWSPDGKQLAVVIRRQPGIQRELLIVDTRGPKFGQRVRLKSNAGGAVSWSPDGKKLVFSTNTTLHLLTVEGNSPPEVIPGQVGKNTNPAWSPDGKWIVFVSDRK